MLAILPALALTAVVDWLTALDDWANELFFVYVGLVAALGLLLWRVQRVRFDRERLSVIRPPKVRRVAWAAVRSCRFKHERRSVYSSSIGRRYSDWWLCVELHPASDELLGDLVKLVMAKPPLEASERAQASGADRRLAAALAALNAHRVPLDPFDMAPDNEPPSTHHVPGLGGVEQDEDGEHALLALPEVPFVRALWARTGRMPDGQPAPALSRPA